MATALAFRKGERIKHPSRSVPACILSAFVPRFGAGGGALSLLVTIALIGVLAAIAIPAYQEYTQRAANLAAYQTALPLQDEITEYAAANQAWPANLTDLGYDSKTLSDLAETYEIELYDEGLIGVEVGTNADGESQYIVLEPTIEEGEILWECYGQDLPTKLLPPDCK